MNSPTICQRPPFRRLLYGILLGLKAKTTLALPIGRDSVVSDVFPVMCVHLIACLRATIRWYAFPRAISSGVNECTSAPLLSLSAQQERWLPQVSKARA